MPVTMGGLASGMDTDGIIDKLLKHGTEILIFMPDGVKKAC